MTINDTFPLYVKPHHKKNYRGICATFLLIYYCFSACFASAPSSEEIAQHEAYDEYCSIADVMLQHAEHNVRKLWNLHAQGARNFELVSLREVVTPAQQRGIYKKIDSLVISSLPGAQAVLDALVEYYKTLISVNYLRFMSVYKNERVDDALTWLTGFGKLLTVPGKNVTRSDFVQQKAAFVKLSMKFACAARAAGWQRKFFSGTLYASMSDFLEPFNDILPACDAEHVTFQCCRCCSLHVLQGIHRGVAKHGFMDELFPKDPLVRVALASGVLAVVALVRNVYK